MQGGGNLFEKGKADVFKLKMLDLGAHWWGALA